MKYLKIILLVLAVAFGVAIAANVTPPANAGPTYQL